MQMTNLRPLGVSGLMRVRNEEEFVEASIESVIGALDELVICYQESGDRTQEILERKQREYPDRIKLHFYPHRIYSNNLTEEEFAMAASLPADSPHLLSGYYNFALSKATYRYGVKIDADQVYFAERFRKLCDAYRNTSPEALTRWEKFALEYLAERLMRTVPKPKAKFLRRLAFRSKSSFYRLYEKALLKKIAAEKCLTWIGGINLYVQEGKNYGARSYTTGEKVIPVDFYNGMVDHCVFEISEQTRYVPAMEFDFVYNGQEKGTYLIERFEPGPQHGSERRFGPIWYHMRWCKKGTFAVDIVPELPFDRMRKLSCRKIERHGLSLHHDYWMVPFSRFLHTYDRDYPSPESLLHRYMNTNKM